MSGQDCNRYIESQRNQNFDDLPDEIIPLSKVSKNVMKYPNTPMKKWLAPGAAACLLAGAVFPPAQGAENYGEALQLAILYYDANQSGRRRP